MKKIVIIILLFMTISGCNQNEEIHVTSKSFIYEKLILFNENLYVPTAQDIGEIEKQIGSIKNYSKTEEVSNPDSFSNYYPEGTKFYKIYNIDIEDAIAIEIADKKYIKAINDKDLR